MTDLLSYNPRNGGFKFPGMRRIREIAKDLIASLSLQEYRHGGPSTVETAASPAHTTEPRKLPRGVAR